jgi:hypothetical protein
MELAAKCPILKQMGFTEYMQGGEKGSVARTAVTEIGDYAVVHFLGEFEGIFKKA